MIAKVLLVSGLATVPLAPLRASDCHAQIVDAMAVAAPAPNAIEIAQFVPAAGASPMDASRADIGGNSPTCVRAQRARSLSESVNPQVAGPH